MKVLLINPWGGEVFPTPAIGYLQATLIAAGVDVTAVDLSRAMTLDDEYDIVAASFHSFSVKHAITLREKFSGWLICGGHHPSALPEQMLEIGYNQVVIGEGEKAIMDIINGDKSPIIYGELSDINGIPFPNYSGLSYTGTMGLPIISSRGCAFQCSFCASARFWKRKYRARTPDDVLNELSSLINKGLRVWMFEDDNFTASKRRAIEICSGIAEMGQFSWQCASRAESLDEELCRALSKAGCKTVWLGIESLSQDSLDRCKKSTTVEKMLKGIEVAERNGIEAMCQFIVGIPGDTINNITETCIAIKASKIRRKGTNTMWILPNTDIYDKAKEYGFNDDIYLYAGAPFYTYEQNMNTLNYWSYLINAS